MTMTQPLWGMRAFDDLDGWQERRKEAARIEHEAAWTLGRPTIKSLRYGCDRCDVIEILSVGEILVCWSCGQIDQLVRL